MKNKNELIMISTPRGSVSDHFNKWIDLINQSNKATFGGFDELQISQKKNFNLNLKRKESLSLQIAYQVMNFTNDNEDLKNKYNLIPGHRDILMNHKALDSIKTPEKLSIYIYALKEVYILAQKSYNIKLLAIIDGLVEIIIDNKLYEEKLKNSNISFFDLSTIIFLQHKFMQTIQMESCKEHKWLKKEIDINSLDDKVVFKNSKTKIFIRDGIIWLEQLNEKPEILWGATIKVTKKNKIKFGSLENLKNIEKKLDLKISKLIRKQKKAKESRDLNESEKSKIEE